MRVELTKDEVYIIIQALNTSMHDMGRYALLQRREDQKDTTERFNAYKRVKEKFEELN